MLPVREVCCSSSAEIHSEASTVPASVIVIVKEMARRIASRDRVRGDMDVAPEVSGSRELLTLVDGIVLSPGDRHRGSRFLVAGPG